MGFLARKDEPTVEELLARVAELQVQVSELASRVDQVAPGAEPEVDYLARARMHLARAMAIKLG